MKSNPIYPICVSIKEKKQLRLLSLLKKFPFVEIRFDAARYTDAQIIKAVRTAQQCIATCRPASKIFSDVEALYSESERQAILIQALRSGASFVDLEFEAKPNFKRPIIALARKKKARVIISVHDFKATPGIKQLEKIIKAAKRQGADIVKIATFAKRKADIQTLASLLARHENLVCIGMGTYGRSLRIAAPMLGSLFTFASSSLGKETAAGQLPYMNMKSIYKKLHLIKE